MKDDSLQRYHEADAEGKDAIVIEELLRLFAERLPDLDVTALRGFIAPKPEQINKGESK
jgi:hypothetical protein